MPQLIIMHVSAPRGWVIAQTEELLVKRRNLLEKKIEQETERAKEFTRTKNKRGASSRLAAASCLAPCDHCVLMNI